MSKKKMRRNWSKNDQPSQKRTQAQEKKSFDWYGWMRKNHRFISTDKLVSFENQLDDSWE